MCRWCNGRVSPALYEKRHRVLRNLDGVWNLVLACGDCNRGQARKHDPVPDKIYLQRLHKRNEFLISSHHPLRETLRGQTGFTTEDRVAFLQSYLSIASKFARCDWKPSIELLPAF